MSNTTLELAIKHTEALTNLYEKILEDEHIYNTKVGHYMGIVSLDLGYISYMIKQNLMIGNLR